MDPFSQQQKTDDLLAALLRSGSHSDGVSSGGLPGPTFQPPSPYVLAQITELQTHSTNSAISVNLPCYGFKLVKERWVVDPDEVQQALTEDLENAQVGDFSVIDPTLTEDDPSRVEGCPPAYELSGNAAVPLGTIVQLWGLQGGNCFFFLYPADKKKFKYRDFCDVEITMSSDQAPIGGTFGAYHLYSWKQLPTVSPVTGWNVGSKNYDFPNIGNAPPGARTPGVVTDGTTLIIDFYFPTATGGTYTFAIVVNPGSITHTATLAWNATSTTINTALSGFGDFTVTHSDFGDGSGTTFTITKTGTDQAMSVVGINISGLDGYAAGGQRNCAIELSDREIPVGTRVTIHKRFQIKLIDYTIAKTQVGDGSSVHAKWTLTFVLPATVSFGAAVQYINIPATGVLCPIFDGVGGPVTTVEGPIPPFNTIPIASNAAAFKTALDTATGATFTVADTGGGSAVANSPLGPFDIECTSDFTDHTLDFDLSFVYDFDVYFFSADYPAFKAPHWNASTPPTSENDADDKLAQAIYVLSQRIDALDSGGTVRPG